MKEIKETKLLRRILEEEDARPAPNRMVFYVPHYEFVVPIGKDHTASIIIDEDSYYELLENEEFSLE